MATSKTQRDAEGLLLVQRQALSALATGKSLKLVCSDLEITERTFQRWFKEEAFSNNFNDMFSVDDLEEVKKLLNLTTLSAVSVYQDAIDTANKKVRVHLDCPHCHKAADHSIEVVDWKARLHAADVLMKIKGVLVERSKKDISVTVRRQLEFHEQMALLAYKKNIPIGPDMESTLRELGYIEGERPALRPGSVEGEFNVIEGDD